MIAIIFLAILYKKNQNYESFIYFLVLNFTLFLNIHPSGKFEILYKLMNSVEQFIIAVMEYMSLPSGHFFFFKYKKNLKQF